MIKLFSFFQVDENFAILAGKLSIIEIFHDDSDFFERGKKKTKQRVMASLFGSIRAYSHFLSRVSSLELE